MTNVEMQILKNQIFILDAIAHIVDPNGNGGSMIACRNYNAMQTASGLISDTKSVIRNN